MQKRKTAQVRKTLNRIERNRNKMTKQLMNMPFSDVLVLAAQSIDKATIAERRILQKLDTYDLAIRVLREKQFYGT